MKRVYESYPDFENLDLPDILEYLEENKLLGGISEEDIIKKTEALLPLTR